MDPTVVAAWIAAGVSVLTLMGTLAAQYFGRRGTKEDAEKAFAEQRDQLNETLKAQSEHLDRTLDDQRTRTLNERFATAAEHLGSDKPAVRLAGVYAMAGLADDWEENRQTCVDVICAHLRMHYEPDPGPDAPTPRRLAFQAIREVRHTVIRVITAHLQENAAVSWQSLNLDFTGVVFDGGDFTGARFSRGRVSFTNAEFTGGTVNFIGARFTGGTVNFNRAGFSGGRVDFSDARFSGSLVSFDGVRLTGGTIDFQYARFSRGQMDFSNALFSGGTVDFRGAQFYGGLVHFDNVRFTGGTVGFRASGFSGSLFYFNRAEFSGGTVDFSRVRDWSTPPEFPWTNTPPVGVKLPPSGAA
jgi:uncharacterized protein YjbI with pentapeptide repeats